MQTQFSGAYCIFIKSAGLTAIRVHFCDLVKMKLIWCLMVVVTLFKDFAEGELITTGGGYINSFMKKDKLNR